MPKDKKAADKSGKDSKSSADSKVNPFAVEISEALTALRLLEAAEEQVVYLSICTLDAYIEKYGKAGLVYLQQQDLLGKLFNNLKRPKVTRMMCLKVLIKLIQIDGILPKAQEKDENVTSLITIFLESEDLVEIEFATYLLSRICELIRLGELLCQESIISKLFTTLVFAMDLDVKLNCLELLLRIVNCRLKRDMIAASKSFNIKTLNYVLQGPFLCLRPVTVEIFHIISAWEMPVMQDQLFQMETMTYLCDILVEDKWTTVQNKALTSIYNCMKHHPVQVKGIESKKFLQFVNFARDNGPDHALACISLLGELVTEQDNRQVLLELRVHDILTDYCKYDCDLVYVQFCNTVSEFCKNCHIIKELANKNVLKEIDRLMRKTVLPWIPYRQAGIQPLYLFTMNNPRVGILIYQSNVLGYILEALVNMNEVEKKYYGMALEMFQCMLGSKCLHKYLWNTDVYKQFINLLCDCDTTYVKLAMDVLQRTFHCQEYRQWFLDLQGVEFLAKMLCKRDCDYIDQAVAFCKFAAKYDDLRKALLRSTLIPVLQEVGAGSLYQKPICESIVNDIYKCEYSIKFHDTWFLDYHEITKNGFCLYVGYKPRNFPADEINDVDKLSYTTTMITVNFHGKKRELLPCAIAHQEPKIIPQTSTFGSFAQAQSIPSVEEPMEEKYIYKLDLPLPDKDPDTDHHLKKYLRKIQALLEQEDTIAHKVVILAKFVASCLCGHDGKLPTKHQYETHIMELKKKLQSNYVPLGNIRIGGMIERALLFKVLGDRVGIPCTLRRTSNFCAWNEVTIYSNTSTCVSSNLRYNSVQHYIVDLMEDIGALLRLGERNTHYYCQKSEKYAHSFEFDIMSSCSELEISRGSQEGELYN